MYKCSCCGEQFLFKNHLKYHKSKCSPAIEEPNPVQTYFDYRMYGVAPRQASPEEHVAYTAATNLIYEWYGVAANPPPPNHSVTEYINRETMRIREAIDRQILQEYGELYLTNSTNNALAA